jgi:phage terminase large subunit
MIKQIDIEAIKERGRRDPVWFILTVLKVKYLTPQQKQVCRSIRDNRRTAVPAGNSVGKTFLAACLVLWFLFCFDNSKVLTTAPTWFQVENLLWREVRTLLSHSLLSGQGSLTLTSLTLSNEWFAVGLSTNDPTRFQGIHAPRILLVFDEATGIDNEIWEAAEGVAVGNNDRFLAIGNPTDPTARFKTVCDSELWNVIRLSGEDHPNVTEDKIIVPGAVTKEWIEEKRIEYGGRESAFYRARVLGLFPEQGDDMLISLADVERSQKRWQQPQGIPDALGVDIARFGSDETVEIELYGSTVAQPRTFHGQNTMQTAGSVKANGADKKAVDDSGLGGGVTDRLKEQGVNVTAFISGEKANDSERFLNRRAESWWLIREMLKDNSLDLPPDNKLAADLTNIKFKYTSRGQIQLESKEDIKKRIGRSPDRGDALAICLAARFAPQFVVTDDVKQMFNRFKL